LKSLPFSLKGIGFFSVTMTTNDSVTTMNSTNLAMPQPPTPLRVREANGEDAAKYVQYGQYQGQYGSGIPRPSTPTNINPLAATMINMTPSGVAVGNDFMTPQQTPQGSPSKTHLPPGAYDLPNAFDNSLRLAPPAAAQSGSPVSKSGIPRLQQFSPAKTLPTEMPPSPTRKGNKENTPPNVFTNAQTGIPQPRSPKKELGTVPALTPAQQSRQDPYRTRDEKPAYLQRGLAPEEMEKLAKPSVKRLANVTQLCKCTTTKGCC
jgi:hypothetical protein